jgi:hypothetical protein
MVPVVGLELQFYVRPNLCLTNASPYQHSVSPIFASIS